MQFCCHSILYRGGLFSLQMKVLSAAQPWWLSLTDVFMYLIFTEITANNFQPVNFSNLKLLKTRFSKIALFSSMLKWLIMGKRIFGKERRWCLRNTKEHQQREKTDIFWQQGWVIYQVRNKTQCRVTVTNGDSSLKSNLYIFLLLRLTKQTP